MPSNGTPLVGMQLGPASLVDEGVGPVLDTLTERAGVKSIDECLEMGENFGFRHES